MRLVFFNVDTLFCRLNPIDRVNCLLFLLAFHFIYLFYRLGKYYVCY